jgi:hypothetical protein
MIKDGKVRPEGCICELCSDILPNWKDIRTKFGYTTLYEIMGVWQRNRHKIETAKFPQYLLTNECIAYSRLLTIWNLIE